jgi:hypothetical protein
MQLFTFFLKPGAAADRFAKHIHFYFLIGNGVSFERFFAPAAALILPSPNFSLKWDLWFCVFFLRSRSDFQIVNYLFLCIS